MEQSLYKISAPPLDQIETGGPPPDGIPSIDNPKFVSVADASKFLQDSDLVLGVSLNGETRAYPLLILVWHEIVNDKVGGVPVAVTYCPLYRPGIQSYNQREGCSRVWNFRQAIQQ